MINKQIRSGDKKVDEYIMLLESRIENPTSNIQKLIYACNDVAGIIADDVILLKENGNDDEIDNRLQMLGSKKNKIYDRFINLVGQIKHFKTISDLSDEMSNPTTKNKKEAATEVETEVKPVKRKANIQDFVINND